MPLDIEPMYHVPEAELHAYLDQALSRSQCVEIERHLAECRACRVERDGIAALRDRTTALLAGAAPRRIRPRPYTELAAEQFQRAGRAHRRGRALMWAASLVAAVGLGWALGLWSHPGAPAVAPGTVARTTATAPVEPHRQDAPAPATERTARVTRPPAPARVASAAVTATPGPADSSAAAPLPRRPAASELATVAGTTAASEPVLDGVWRTVTYAPGEEGQSDWMPRVDGVPVVQVKVREAPQGGRPLTLVTQQLASGEMISTVEGPAVEVAALLSRQSGQSASAELQDMQLRPVDGDSVRPQPAAGGGPRTLAVFGSASADSLKALMLRVK